MLLDDLDRNTRAKQPKPAPLLDLIEARKQDVKKENKIIYLFKDDRQLKLFG